MMHEKSVQLFKCAFAKSHDFQLQATSYMLHELLTTSHKLSATSFELQANSVKSEVNLHLNIS